MNEVTREHLMLLAYLHEHVSGFGPQFSIDAETVRNALAWPDDVLTRTASYLDQHRLIGIHWVEPIFSSNWKPAPESVFLTGGGERLMLALENSPGLARRITVKTAAIIWDSGRAVVVKIVSDFVMGR